MSASDLLDDLRAAARRDGVAAWFALAEHLLCSGATPADLREAQAALAAAHAAGHAAAAERLAMLAAAGVGRPRDLPEALTLLGVAAERGSLAARGQLCALAGAAAPTGGWEAFARSIDLSSWGRPLDKTVLSVTPRISAIERFVSPAVCDWIIAACRDRIAPAMVFDQTSGAAIQADARSNSALEITFGDLDVVVALVRAAIARAIDVPEFALEPPQVLHYDVGQSFAPHYDYLDVRVPGYAAEAARNGQRVATFLIYLNDAFDGGETDFPLIRLRHRAPRGGALYFANVGPDGAPDPRTLHAGLSPTAGEKWLLSQWVRHRSPT